MKKFWGIQGRTFIAGLLGATLSFCSTLSAATLRWEPNPLSDNIAFYTVYAESVTEILKWDVGVETSFPLEELIASVTYLLSVSATSAEGLESERSAAISYLVPELGGPTITAQPVSTSLASGNPLMLSVAATSLSPINYEWRKDGQRIPGQDGETLTIESASPTDSGRYTVLLSNQGGSIESSGSWVTVQDAPSVITQPTSLTVDGGTRVALQVEATGTDLQYQWYKNDLKIFGETNATLSFASVTAQNRGIYHVALGNLVENIVSEKATITVNIYPVSILEPPAGTNLTTGGTILLQVKVTGSPPFNFEWFKDGFTIPNAASDTLLISPASLEDSGDYRVRISNPENWVTSTIARATVRELSAADGSLSLNMAPDGSLRISAVASPNTTYEVQKSDNLSIPNWIRIQDVTANSAGLFQVNIPTQSPVGFIRTVRK